MGLSHSPRIVTDGLVLCLDAANKRSYPGTGTTWTDLKGGNNGTFTNMDASNFSDDNGGSFVFDGTNEYINCGPTNSITDGDESEISICCWVKAHTSSHDAYTVSLKRLSTDSTLVSIVVNQQNSVSHTANYLGFIYSSTSNPVHRWVTKNDSTFYNKWTHVSATVNTTAATLYVNGVNSGQNTSDTFSGPSISNNTANTTIGAFKASDSNSLYLDGDISLVQVYTKTLTPDEIRQNYQATVGRYT